MSLDIAMSQATAKAASPPGGRTAAPALTQAKTAERDELSAAGGRGGCRLGGDLKRAGFSFVWHDFERPISSRWTHDLPPRWGEICLNLSGSAEISDGHHQGNYAASTAGFYFQGGRHRHPSLDACRPAWDRHQFITLTLSPRFLQRHLLADPETLHPIVRRVLHEPGVTSGVSQPCGLTSSQQYIILHLRQPPVAAAAQPLWYQVKALELMAEFFFAPSAHTELFCDRQKRLAKDRVERAMAILRHRFEEPPSLEELGREIGCSPFYLSRTFSRELGLSMPQFLRQIRMEKAAELLRSGTYNVTEAAMAVGYSSLSHFSVAFCQIIGCCPGLYPAAAPRS